MILTAKIVNPQRNGKNRSGDRKLLCGMSIIALTGEAPVDEYKPGMKAVVTARYWGAKREMGNSNDASLWVRMANGESCSGYGTASGWGYHRPSAALDSAISSAGIKLSQSIDGVGEQAMESALRAIAEAAGWTPPFLFVTHG